MSLQLSAEGHVPLNLVAASGCNAPPYLDYPGHRTYFLPVTDTINIGKPLSASCVEQFRDEGYTLIPSFFSVREIEAMRAELDRFCREDLIRNVATDDDGETHSKRMHNLQICPITPRSDFYRSLPYHPRVSAAVGQLIGDPFVFYLDQIFLKPARTGIGTDWHQDNAYFKVADPTKGTAMWVALHDANQGNGTLHVIPRSYLESYAHDRDPRSDHHIHCPVPEERAVSIELPAGGVAFFNYGTAHSTKANLSDLDRAGLALHFLRTDFIPDHVLQSDKPRRYAHVTGPDATGGLSEYGSTIAGTWDDQVNRLLTT